MVLVSDASSTYMSGARYRGKSDLTRLLVFSPVIEVTAIYLYYIRDCFAGFFRYFLSIIHLDFLWFIPDFFALLCAFLFTIRYVVVGRNLYAFFLMAYMPVSVILAYAFFNDSLATTSGIKMFLPVFVGLCFASRPVDEMKSMRWLLYFVFVMSVIGILWNSVTKLPWEGFAYQGVGVAQRDATRLWWSGEDRRLGGFAADSTMAGYFMMIGFTATLLHLPYLYRLPLAVLTIYTINLSTSKTSLGIASIIFLILMITGLFGKPTENAILKRLARLSYLSILVPYVLIAIAGGVDLTSISQKLYSMEDRINNSWVLPFQYMSELFPMGFLTGCGLGCFNYPQQLFRTSVQKYWVPVDNFYMGTYLMLGLPFLIFLFRQCFGKTTSDPMKVVQTISMNLFGVTVLCYGPASSLIMFAILFSNQFSSPRYVERMIEADMLFRQRLARLPRFFGRRRRALIRHGLRS